MPREGTASALSAPRFPRPPFTLSTKAIYMYLAAFGGGLGNFGGLLVHFLERGRGAGFSFPGVLLHQSEPVTGTWPVG